MVGGDWSAEEGFAITDRGGIIENRHRVHIAVVDGTGNLLYGVGNPFRVTLARSAVKPIQTLAILKTKADRLNGFEEPDLALMCASHSSEKRHIERARAMLAKISAEEQDMCCGGHPSFSNKINSDWVKNDFVPSSICNNCSGKHAGMLAGAKALGAGIQGYDRPEHPMQELVRQVVAKTCGLESHQVLWAIDGCNLPTPAFPLDRLARIYAKLAASKSSVGADSYDMARIYDAMAHYPELVAGEERFCTELMRAFDGGLVGKLGADACYGIGIRDSPDTRRLGSSNGLGIAVKIDDGNIDVLYAVVTEALHQLNIGTIENREKLARFHQNLRLNTMGVVTGGISFSFKLKPCPHE